MEISGCKEKASREKREEKMGKVQIKLLNASSPSLVDFGSLENIQPVEKAPASPVQILSH